MVLGFVLFEMVVLVVGICVFVQTYRDCIVLGRLLGWVVEILVGLVVGVHCEIVTWMFQMVV